MALSVVALCVLIPYARSMDDATHGAALVVFGLSMVMLYMASTLFHAVGHPTVKPILQYIDHIAIYLLIAGTYTPFVLICIPDDRNSSMIWLVWGLAFAGVVFKSLTANKYPMLLVSTYLAMGWLGLVILPPVLRVLPSAGIAWLVAGGLLYTFGVYFYLREQIRHNHAIWHLCVMAGTFCHFAAVFWFVLPDHV